MKSRSHVGGKWERQGVAGEMVSLKQVKGSRALVAQARPELAAHQE